MKRTICNVTEKNDFEKYEKCIELFEEGLGERLYGVDEFLKKIGVNIVDASYGFFVYKDYWSSRFIVVKDVNIYLENFRFAIVAVEHPDEILEEYDDFTKDILKRLKKHLVRIMGKKITEAEEDVAKVEKRLREIRENLVENIEKIRREKEMKEKHLTHT